MLTRISNSRGQFRLGACLGVQQNFWMLHWGNAHPPRGMLSDDVFIKKKKLIKRKLKKDTIIVTALHPNELLCSRFLKKKK